MWGALRDRVEWLEESMCEGAESEWVESVYIWEWLVCLSVREFELGW